MNTLHNRRQSDVRDALERINRQLDFCKLRSSNHPEYTASLEMQKRELLDRLAAMQPSDAQLDAAIDQIKRITDGGGVAIVLADINGNTADDRGDLMGVSERDDRFPQL